MMTRHAERWFWAGDPLSNPQSVIDLASLTFSHHVFLAGYDAPGGRVWWLGCLCLRQLLEALRAGDLPAIVRLDPTGGAKARARPAQCGFIAAPIESCVNRVDQRAVVTLRAIRGASWFRKRLAHVRLSAG